MPNERRAILKHMTGLSAAMAFPRSSALALTSLDLTPEMFGAKGDGQTNDTAAFQRLSSKIAEARGGTVSLRPGARYIVGRQAAGRGGTFLSGEPVLHVETVPLLIVRMNGATLKFADGLRFGSFDPRTGRARRGRAASLQLIERADIGAAIVARNVSHFVVQGGSIDGNSRNTIVGGEWGDTGRQSIHYGIAAYSCDSVLWEDLRIFDSCLDGWLYSYDHLTDRHPPKPFICRRVEVDRVGRNCGTITGTNAALLEDVRHRNAGGAPNIGIGTISTAPASCLDVEAEQSSCRNISVRRSQFLMGPSSNTAFVADSGKSENISFEDTTFAGVVWTSKPRTIFRRCQVHGRFGRLLGGQKNPQENTSLIDCTLTDSALGEERVVSDDLFLTLQGAGGTVRISGCTIDLRRTRLDVRTGVLEDVTINFGTGTNKIANRDWAILGDFGRWTRVHIVDRIPAALRPADAYFVGVPEARLDGCRITSPAQKILWGTWSPGGGGHSGAFNPRRFGA